MRVSKRRGKLRKQPFWANEEKVSKMLVFFLVKKRAALMRHAYMISCNIAFKHDVYIFIYLYVCMN